VRSDPQENAEALTAYADYESQLTVRHLEIGCFLVMALMPAGVVLDYFVYPSQIGFFLALRLVCVLLAVLVWWFVRAPISKRFHRLLGLIVALLPVFFICWMIYATKDPTSPYYAGLNLSLLAIALIMRWSVELSAIASALVLAMYVSACLLCGPISAAQRGVFINNIYFLVLTSIIVVVGSRLHRLLRIREFGLRYELDKNRKEIASQNLVLESTIGKLKEAQTQLVQTEKLASLGRLSAGIIHEINNPLNFASTGLFTLRKKGKYLAPEQQEDYAEVLKDVEEGVTRVKNIVLDLRMFTHPETESRDQVDLEEVVAAALRFLSAEWQDKVRIEPKLAEDQTVWANKNLLIHALLNLLQNSIDALKTKAFENEQPTIWIESRLEQGKSLLVVRDNGTGIEAEHLNKIFDPFYTTKDVGAGMGMGLAICHRIVQDCEGRISVRTEPGKFCEFTLEFPAKGQQ